MNEIITFGLPFVIFIIITFFYYRHIQKGIEIKFKDISQYECLLMGDSQIQKINDELFTPKTFNFASSGEHYYFTYEKLLKLLKIKNYKIKKIILGVSVHNFGPLYNRLINIDFIEGKNSLERYLYFIEPLREDKFSKYLLYPNKSTFIGIYGDPDWGGVRTSNRSNTDSLTIKKGIDMYFEKKQSEARFCLSQKKYLFLIDSLCKINNIDLYILSTPYLYKFKSKIKKEYFEFYYETINKLKNVIFIDFLSDNPPENWMSNGNHLNEKGSSYYSNKINKIIIDKYSHSVKHISFGNIPKQTKK